MNIGDAARLSGLPAKTIRYYEEIGLLTPLRSTNGYRSYRESDLHRLTFLGRARALGFSIEECRALLALYADRSRASAEVKRIAEDHLAEIDRKKCIAWEYGQYCMVCHEFCPYLAIDSVERNGVECPTVKPDMCRGCGACQVNCPALPDKAIVVKSIPQRAARPLEV